MTRQYAPEIAFLFDASSAERQRQRQHDIEQLFEERRVSLHRYLVSIGLSTHEGEEIIQEAFVQVCMHLRKGGDKANLRGWLFRVAHNLALKRFRRRRFWNRSAAIDERLAETHPDPRPNPEEQFALSERDRRVLAVVSTLPERDRFCLYLRAEGLRYREIATVAGMSVGGVANSLSRCIAALSEAALG